MISRRFPCFLFPAPIVLPPPSTDLSSFSTDSPLLAFLLLGPPPPPPPPHLLEITYFPWTHKSKTFPNYRMWQKLAKCCKYHAEYTIWHRCGTNESGCIYLMKMFPTAWLMIFRRNAFCAHISNGNLLVYNSNFTFEIRIGAMRHVAATMRELPLEQTPTNLINRLNPLKNLSIWAPYHKRLFHRNSNSTEISFHSHLDSNSVIATKFCTWHDSCAVVAFAKMCCDLMASNGITARRRFHRIWFAGKKSLVTRAPVWTRIYHYCMQFTNCVWKDGVQQKCSF